jgi:hypothetical protein
MAARATLFEVCLSLFSYGIQPWNAFDQNQEGVAMPKAAGAMLGNCWGSIDD